MTKTTHSADAHHDARQSAEPRAVIPLRWLVTQDAAVLQYDTVGDGSGWSTIPQVPLAEAAAADKEGARVKEERERDAPHD